MTTNSTSTSDGIVESFMHKVNTQHGLTGLLVASVVASLALTFVLFRLLLSMEKQTLLDTYQDLVDDNNKSQKSNKDNTSTTTSAGGYSGGDLELEIELSELGKNPTNTYASLGTTVSNGMTNGTTSTTSNGGAAANGGAANGSTTSSKSDAPPSHVNMKSDYSNRDKGVIEIEEVGGEDDDAMVLASNQARMRLSLFRKAVLGFVTLMLVSMTSLLLVYSNAPAFIGVIGWVLVCAVAILGQILEEIRRKRCDRLLAVATVLLMLASTLNLTTYSSIAVSQEDLYRGKARIVGYDNSKYNEWQDLNQTTSTSVKGKNKGHNGHHSRFLKNDVWKDTKSSRTDLQVQWGGNWGCPLQPSKQCKADIQGALCERDESSTATYDDDAVYQKSDSVTKQQVYYDSKGNVVDNYSDTQDLYDKHGNPIEHESSQDTTTVNSKTGEETSDHDKYEDIEYYDDKNTTKGGSKVKDETEYDENYNSKTGGYNETESYQKFTKKGQTAENDTYEYDENDKTGDASETENINQYYKDGSTKEQETYEDEETPSEDIEVDTDVAYNKNGTLVTDTSDESIVDYDDNGNEKESMDYDVSENDKGNPKGGTEYDVDYKDTTYDDNGKASEKVTEKEKMDYDDNDTDITEDVDYTDTKYDDGKASSKVTEKEKVDYDSDTDGDITEDIDKDTVTYDKDGKAVKDDTEDKEHVEYDSAGNLIDDTESTTDNTPPPADDTSTTTTTKNGNKKKNTGGDSSTTTGDNNGTGNDGSGNKNGGGRRLRRLADQDGEDLETENEELQEQNDELEKENEEMKEELNEYEEDLEDEEEVVEEEEEQQYSYDDDMYYDGYWGDTDWDEVWGDYADSCYKVFDASREGVTMFNPNKPPGNDDWPYLNIYGNCQTCEAYIVDIYSTEHFRHVQTYKVASLGYGIAAMVGLTLTLFVSIRRHLCATKSEKEMSFLSGHHHGMLA